MKRPRSLPSVESAFVTFAVISLVIILLAAVRGLPTTDGTEVASTRGGARPGSAAAGGIDGAGGTDAVGGTDGAFVDNGGGRTAGGSGGGGAGGLTEAEAAQCASGQNGGNTDSGVSGDRIKLGATVVESGIGASFLGPVRLGISAVAKQVNAAGGICGRQLDLVLKDDGWDLQRGRGFIQNLVEDEGVFALAVMPSSEGLDAAADFIDSKGIPVVGTDGLLASQYTHGWIWPVATSTLSTMHVMAKDAFDRGARNFSIVYDRKFRFGLEGAFAFNEAVKRLTGSDIPGYSDPFSSPKCQSRFCGIQAGASSYNAEAQVLSDGCSAGITGGAQPCDFNALLLEPSEALTWYNSGGPPVSQFVAGGKGAGAAQPLFTRDFAQNCQLPCDKLVVWTGFNPPIERFASTSGVAQYVADVQAESANADVNNQFLEGGYLGMQLLVEGLRQSGPDLTRDRLRSVLDTLTFDVGLTRPLTWSGGRFANTAAQGFQIGYQGSFNGWREFTNGFIDDPWVGQDVRTG